MSILHDGLNKALTVVKAIPTVFRQSDQEFTSAGGKIARILGLNTAGFDSNAEAYTNHVWVYAAINAIARNVSGVPFVFQSAQGRTKDNHAFSALFERPNRWQGFGSFMETLLSWWHLNGEVMIVMNRNAENEVPKEMAAIDSTDFAPVLSENTGRLIGWIKENNNGEKIPFRLHEVIYIRFWNPNDEWRGLAPVQAAAQGIKQDLLANRFNQEFFKNSGTPGGVIEIEQNLDDKQFERIVRQYEDRHGGPDNAHKMLILEGGAKFKPSITSQKDMDFLNQKRWNRDEVLAAFGIPKLEVGIIEEGANLAVIKTQSREFWLKNLIPKMKLIEWTLWAQLFSRINGGRVWAEFDLSAIDALQDEFHEKVKTARSLWEMGYTLNQINKRLGLGLPENSWQNTAFMPVNITPISLDSDGTPIPPNLLPPPADPLQAPTVGVDTSPQTGPEPKAPTQTPAQSREFDEFVSKLASFFFRQRVKQLKAMEHDHKALLDPTVEKEKLEKYLENRGLMIDCSEIVDLVHCELVKVLVLQNGHSDTILNETKRLYNRVSKELPEMARLVLERHTRKFVAGVTE